MDTKTLKFIVIGFLLTIILPVTVLAHPGNTDGSGCHTCRTNCSSWGLSYGEYHCHNSKGPVQPLYPVSSTYGAGGTGYTTPAPYYASPYIPTTPSCPSMSLYDSLTGGCKCFSGYVVDKDIFGEESCVSGNSYCHKKIGIMSSYSSLTKKCECDLGYEFDGSSCVYKSSNYNYSYGSYSGSGTCPLNSSQSLTDSTKCTCNTGFQTNLAKDACVAQTIPQATKIKINRMLKEGSVGEDVAQLQQFLMSKGYYSGLISNNYNYGTKMAVTKFQKANNLSQTGIVNVKTRALINSL